jgi:uncharacterized protein YkwD
MPAAAIRLIALDPVTPREFSINAKEISIGSAAGNDLVILNEPSVSRRHAKIECRRRAYRVVDLESTNGTYVNGERVRGASIFRIGDELRFGRAQYRFNPSIAKRSPILSMRTVVTFALLFAIAFGVTKYRIAWNRFESSSAPVVPAPIAPVAGIPTSMPTGANVVKAAAISTPVYAAPAKPPTPAAPLPAGPRWLDALNQYRAISGLSPVTNDLATSLADEAHARYLVENYKDAIRHSVGLGAQMHEEDRSNRWYTPGGASAANNSDVAQWPGPIPPPSTNWAIDGWISGPFHRLSMLNPRLRSASEGNWCEGALCIVALNVVAGADVTDRGTPLASPVRFPGPDSTLTMNLSEYEWPDPISACPGYTAPSGLPITLQVAFFQSIKLDDFSLKLHGSPVEACGIDSASYVNPDPEAQRRGRDILTAFGAVVVVPRTPLVPGKYDVSITANGKSYSWSFTIAG